MAAPLRTAKQTVDLAGPVRVSRIRRDPPPLPVKQLTRYERDQRDARHGAVGVIAFALAILLILFALGNAAGWSASEYTIRFEL